MRLVNPEQILNGLASSMTGADPAQATEMVNVLTAANGQALFALISNLNQQDEQDDENGIPKAYLNYLAFDENMKVLPDESGALRVGTSDQWHTLSNELPQVKFSGFLYIYSSNSTSREVNFDNLKAVHYGGDLQSEFHYYPFGLSINLSQAIGAKEAPILFIICLEIN